MRDSTHVQGRMSFDGLEMLACLGESPDGVFHRARDRAGRLVELRILGRARADAGRWETLCRRLRLAAQLRHPAVAPLRELGLEADPPFVILGCAAGRTWSRWLEGRLPLPPAQALEQAEPLAGALAAGHRLGLAHGRLGPETVFVDELGRPYIDLSGIDTGSDGAASPSAGLPDFAADVVAFGKLLYLLRTGRQAERLPAPPASDGDELDRLIAELLAGDPWDLPSAAEVAARLRGAQVTRALSESSVAALTPPGPPTPPQRLGRFRLIEKLGQGGMGEVWRAEDTGDGKVVAIKLVRADLAGKPEMLRRFRKEARLLAEANSSHVANLLEINEDAGVHYLVMEFVAGKNVRQLLAERGRLDEPSALNILIQVARGLQVAHERGIIHRDIKPDNLVLVEAAAPAAAPRVKLLDFGLARHVVETESLHMTQTGAVLGTPLYMAPEQCMGTKDFSPRTDVYAMGAVLFHLLAGRPPFEAEEAVAICLMHCSDPAPALKPLNPALSDAVCQVVDKALAKAPEARYADAGAMGEDLERLLRGEPTSIAVHPRLPACDPRRVRTFEWTWDLAASPAQLWPHVSNTERLNRAVGLPAVRFTTRREASRDGKMPAGVRRFGEFRKAGMVAAWEEHAFEWVEGRRMGVLREYSSGPFRWLTSVVELTPRPDGGTRLTHQARLEPVGLVGRLVAAIEVGIKGRRALERVYRQIDAFATGAAGAAAGADPFEPPVRLSAQRRRRLDGLLDRLLEQGVPASVVERLGEFLSVAPDQEVARIRPLALAGRLGLDPEQLVQACLQGARAGLLVLLWDILCPVCRIPSDIKETLRQIEGHGRCEACNLDFQLDFANSVELIFRLSPEIRATQLGTYCIGGPVHSPHVAAQARLGAGERFELQLALAEGAYRFRGPQLPFAVDFRVQPQAHAARWDLHLSHGPADLPRQLRGGSQVLALTNDFEQELIVRVERIAPREDALTAARASFLPLFRELFPGEVLAPGQMVSVATVNLLATELDGAERLFRAQGDAPAFAAIHEHFRLLAEHIRGAGGTVVKMIEEGLLAAFDDPAAAVGTALELSGVLAAAAATRQLRLRAGVHRGPAMVTSLNNQLDYFGVTAKVAARLPRLVGPGEVGVTDVVMADPLVGALLRARQRQGETVPMRLPGLADFVLHRLVTSEASPAAPTPAGPLTWESLLSVPELPADAPRETPPSEPAASARDPAESLELAQAFINRGEASEAPAALEWYSRAVDMLFAAFGQERTAPADRCLCQALAARAQAWKRVGNAFRALADLNRALNVDDGTRRRQILQARCVLLARVGSHARAVAEADALAGANDLDAEALCELAAVCSLAVTAVRQDSRLPRADRARIAELCTRRALKLLARADAGGYFNDPARRDQVRQNPDFAPLTQQEEFRQLMVCR